MHGANLVRRQSFAEKVNRRHLAAEHSFFVKLRRGPDVTFIKGLKCKLIKRIRSRKVETYVICGNEPRHLCAGGQLPINQTFNFTFCPPIVDINNRQHVPLQETKIIWILKSVKKNKPSSVGIRI